MGTILASGWRRRSSLIIPLPVTWLGRQAKGWEQMMLGKPLSLNSSISAVRNHPSPQILPPDNIGSVFFNMWSMGLDTKYPCWAKSLLAGRLYSSMSLMPKEETKAERGFLPRCLYCQRTFVKE